MKHKPVYQEAIDRAGYEYDLKYIKEINCIKNNKKNRPRKIIYFNPPYSNSVETNIGEKVLKLVKNFFPKVTPLYKKFNKNSIKVTYSCLPSMGARIAGSIMKKIEKIKKK